MPRPTVQDVFALVRASAPTANVERLTVTHPADDDNVWWVWLGPSSRAGQRSVQLDSHPAGLPPFHVEGDEPGQRLETSDVAEAATAILQWLGRP